MNGHDDVNERSTDRYTISNPPMRYILGLLPVQFLQPATWLIGNNLHAGDAPLLAVVKSAVDAAIYCIRCGSI